MNDFVVSWSAMKSFIDARKVSVQWILADGTYYLNAFDESFNISCVLHTSNPNEDLAEFETTYKPLGNMPPMSSRAVPQIGNFLNAGSKDMNVLGTLVAPVDFSLTPGVGEILFLKSVSIFILDPGSLLPGTFGAISLLTNGLLFQVKSKGEAATVFTLKDNTDVAMMFTAGEGSSSLLGTSGGFIDSNDAFIGTLTFEKPIVLVGDQSDYARFRVQDTLTLVDNLRTSYMIWRR